MYTKVEKKLMGSMMRKMKKKELRMAIAELIAVNEDQSETIHNLVDELNRLKSKTSVIEVEEKTYKTKAKEV